MSNLTNQIDIKNILQQAGLKPQHKLGQNFLIDQEVLNDIVAAADIKAGDLVLEVGAGLGVLTQSLINSPASVFSVELDDGLYGVLKKQFKGVEQFNLWHGDINSYEFDQAFIKWLDGKNSKGGYKVVANIPYQITSLLIRKFLTFKLKPSQLVLLVQKEVAERIVAQPGAMSILAISVQYYGQPKIVREVSRDCFYPAPAVDSAVLSIDCAKPFSAKHNEAQTKFFFKVVKAGFSAKRKKLYNNLASLGYDKDRLKEIFDTIGLKIDVRAQNLSLFDWNQLAEKLAI